MTVERVRVGEVLRLARRPVVVEPTAEYELLGLYSFGKGVFRRGPLMGSALGDYKFFASAPGDLVLSNIGAWEGGIGYVGPADVDLIANQRVLSYVPRDRRIDTNWARWFFLSESGMKLIRQAAPGTTMRNRTLAISRFESLTIPLPAIEEQRRVAESLNRAGTRCARLVKLLNRSEALRCGAANAIAFRAGLVAPEFSFGSLFELKRRAIEVDPAATYQEIGVRSFGRGIFHKSPLPGASVGTKRVFEIRDDDLVISNVFGWEGAVAVASSAEAGMIGSHRFMTWVPQREGIDPEWVARYLTTPEGIGRLRQASPGSAGRNRTLAVARLKDVNVRVPTPEVQAAVVQFVRGIGRASDLAARTQPLIGAITPAVVNQQFAMLP